MRTIECFLVEPTDRAQRRLRRYRSSSVGACPLPHGYHDASVPVGEAPVEWTDVAEGNRVYKGWFDPKPPHDDPRWPTHCACGYAFAADDEWQACADLIYVRRDTGAKATLNSMPPGAMWDASWLRVFGAGSDGLSLVVRTPGGDWHTDGPSRSNGVEGPGWTRTGTVPRVTVRPSILMPGYHGFLTDGRLEEC